MNAYKVQKNISTNFEVNASKLLENLEGMITWINSSVEVGWMFNTIFLWQTESKPSEEFPDEVAIDPYMYC